MSIIQMMADTGNLVEFVSDVFRQDRETRYWELYLNRIQSDEPYDTWRKKIGTPARKSETVEQDKIADSIADSRNILGSFKPDLRR